MLLLLHPAVPEPGAFLASLGKLCGRHPHWSLLQLLTEVKAQEGRPERGDDGADVFSRGPEKPPRGRAARNWGGCDPGPGLVSSPPEPITPHSCHNKACCLHKGVSL